jgi:hypothetical protein
MIRSLDCFLAMASRNGGLKHDPENACPRT